MLPNGELAPKAHVSGFTFPVKQPGDFREDWELAGVALNDTSQGLRVKLWHLEAKYNQDTGLMDAVVSAPGVAPTVLFSAADIKEVALAFDQNMNPCVAYVSGGTPKLYWYDPTIPDMTHTTMPSGMKDMRLTLDEKRGNPLTGDSDIVLAYINAQNLCVRYQRERYDTEHVLRSGIGAGASLVSMAMNDAYRLQFRLRGYTLNDPSAQVVAEPYVADVQLDLLKRSGVDVKNVDVSQIWIPIEGYKVATEAGADTLSAPLREAYFYDPYESDGMIRFALRAKSEPIAHITKDDLIEAEKGQAVEVTRAQEIELLRKINVTTVDSSIDYVTNTQTAERIATTVAAKGEQSSALPITSSPDFAASVALRKIKTAWGEFTTYKFGTTLKYSYLTPTDVVLLDVAHGTVPVRIMQIEEDSGRLYFEGIEHSSWAYSAEGKGQYGAPPTSTTPGLVGDTIITIVDIPVQRESDDELGYYIAAQGTGEGWRGGVVQFSIDGGATVYASADVARASSIGQTTTTLLQDISAEYYDAQTLGVVIDVQLESVSKETLYQYTNRAAILGDSGWEVLQYETATLDDVDTYTLGGLVRGRYVTLTDAATSGAPFILIDDALQFVQIPLSVYDMTVMYKAVSYGQDPDEVSWQTMTVNKPMSQMEWPPAHVTAERNGSDDVTVTWVERPRLGAETAPRHSKYFTGYRVKYSDGATFDVMGTTHTRTGAPANQTITVVGLNSIAGEGIESEAVTA